MMTEDITPGKLKGLKGISTEDGFFIIAALDHRNSLKSLINPMKPKSVSAVILKTIKMEFTKTFSSGISAVLLDPEYGLTASSKSVRDNAGLIMCLEKSDYSEKKGIRFTKLSGSWNIKKLKEKGADAIKLLLYYRPYEESCKKQLNLVKKVAEDCRKFDIAFVCEPFVYPLKGEADFKASLPGMVIETAKNISDIDVDLLKLQFPGDVNSQNDLDLKKNCKDLDATCKVPWVLLSGGAKYGEFLKQTEIAVQCNASGIMVGRALWQEAFENKELQEIIKFAKTESLSRLNRLSSVVKKGMPWFERVSA
jgi:tagatose 1,6-diphosphate aldolase